MKKEILVLLALVLVGQGCSNLMLKRCDSAAAEVDLWSCPEHVSGKFRMCQKPVDTFHCEAPQ